MNFIIKNKYYIISFGTLLAISFTNMLTPWTGDITQMNIYDAFLRIAVEEGGYTAIAVIIAAIIPTFNDKSWTMTDINNSSKSMADRFITLYFPKALRMGLVFLVANIFAFFICLILSSKSAAYTGLGYGYLGTFGNIRGSSPIIYFALYMVNCSIFGLLMSIFSQSIADITTRKHLVPIICILYYYSYLFLPVEQDIYSITACLFPGYFYSFLKYELSVGQRLLGFTLMALIPYLLFCLSQFKNKLRSKS